MQTETDERALLDQGRTLRADWYTDGVLLALEREHIYKHAWQYAGAADQLAEPGSFITRTICGVPVIALRDLTGRLRAYINVCSHRGSQLINEPCGRRKSLQCSYHAWTWDLEGNLRAAPGSRDERWFEPEDFGLIPAQADTWGPFLFLNVDSAAAPLSEILCELPDLVAETGLDVGGLHLRHATSYAIAANWKVVVDNYLECYHCPVAHPAFSDLIDVSDYSVQEYRYFSVQGAGKKATNKASPYDISAGVEEGFYAFLWPNFTLNVYPGPGNVSINYIHPVDESHTRMDYEYWFADTIGDETATEFISFVDQVQREDTVLCESVQRGLQSGFIDRGRLMLSRERALQHFQKLVLEDVPSPVRKSPSR